MPSGDKSLQVVQHSVDQILTIAFAVALEQAVAYRTRGRRMDDKRGSKKTPPKKAVLRVKTK